MFMNEEQCIFVTVCCLFLRTFHVAAVCVVTPQHITKIIVKAEVLSFVTVPVLRRIHVT